MEREIAEFLTFTTAVVATAVSGDPPPPGPSGPRASGPWYRKLPGTKKYLPLVRGFAESGGRVSLTAGDVAAVSARIAPPLQPQDSKLFIDFRYSLFGDAEQSALYGVKYPTDTIRSLCMGHMTRFGPGAARFDPNCLLPGVSVDGESTIIQWATPPACEVQIWQAGGPIRRLLGKWIKALTNTTIDRIVIGPAYIDVQAGSLLMNNAIPRLVPE